MKRLVRILSVGILILAALGAASWPLYSRLTTHVISEGKAIYNANIFPLWDSWYVSSRWPQIAEHPSQISRTPMWFYPFGVNLSVTNPCHYIQLVAAAVRPLVGFPADVNIEGLFILLLNGLGFFIACRKLGIGYDVAAVSAVLYSLNPYAFRHAFEGGTDQAITWFFVIYLVFFLEACMRGGRKTIVLATLFLGLTGFFYWFTAAFAVVLGFLALPLFMLLQPQGRRLAPAVRLFVIYILFLTISLPLLYPILSQGLQEGKVQGLSLDTVLPGGEKESASELFILGNAPGDFFGPWSIFTLVTALLSLTIFKLGEAKHLFWFGVAVVFYLFSLGGWLTLPFVDFSLLMPFTVLKFIVPIFTRIVDCERFSIVVYAACALLFATSISSLFDRVKPGKRSRMVVLIVLLAGSCLMGYLGRFGHLVPVPDRPVAADSLRRFPPRAVIDVPLLWQETVTEAAWFQTFHGFPIMTGVGVEVEYGHPKKFDQLVAGNPFLQVVGYRTEWSDERLPEYRASLNKLAELGFGYIIYHKKVKGWTIDSQVQQSKMAHYPSPDGDDGGFELGLPPGQKHSFFGFSQDDQDGFGKKGVEELPPVERKVDLSPFLERLLGRPKVTSDQADVYFMD